MLTSGPSTAALRQIANRAGFADMTAEAPDPRTFKSWEDAFQYPVPVVRRLEQQLRSNADDNREKLRSLVG